MLFRVPVTAAVSDGAMAMAGVMAGVLELDFRHLMELQSIQKRLKRDILRMRYLF